MKALSFGIVVAALAVCCSAPFSLGQESEPASETDADVVSVADDLAEPAILDELQDPAFDKYVSLEFLREAWTSLDPAALADAGLQLAEGERILFRSHKAISAQEVLQTAVRVAVQRKDRATLDRLAAAAKALGQNELAASAASASKLADQQRGAQPSITVDLNDVSPDLLANYLATVEIVETARIRGDQVTLDELGKDLAESDEWPPQIREHLTGLIAAARQGLPQTGAVSSEVLDRLQGESRATYYYYFKNPLWFTVKIKVQKSSGGSWYSYYIGAYKTKKVSASRSYVKWKVRLANGLYSAQKTLQCISNISKMLHDTAMVIISNIG